MRSRQPGISPEVIAMAVAVTIMATAGTGSIKKVMGTNSATAMVALRPGTAPTNRPNMAAINITPSTNGSVTWANAADKLVKSIGSPCKGLKQAPWQRHLENAVKHEVNDQHTDQSHKRRTKPAHTEGEKQYAKQDKGTGKKTQGPRQFKIKHQGRWHE